MRSYALEYSGVAYVLDFVFYGVVSVALAIFLAAACPPGQRLSIAILVPVGLAVWTLVEYLIHRFLLHGMKPFSTWHAEHHQRPTALLGSPTVMSASIIFALAFLPALVLGNLWRACALTCGIAIGYLAYGAVHHATHHWRADNAWTRRRKQWHALHHSAAMRPGHYGVTTGAWDRVFGTDKAQRR